MFCNADYVRPSDYRLLRVDLATGKFKSDEFKQFHKDGRPICQGELQSHSRSIRW
jgi:hypothetical protein